MAPNFLNLSTGDKPVVDWESATGDNPDAYDLNRSGPLLDTNLNSLPKDALGFQLGGREVIPSNSGPVLFNGDGPAAKG
jgi:hypothetical protein